jgi:hypothetical protein
MATTTNYGWAEPDNTSLVKNGAQDIRILGDAIDTSVWNIGYGQAGKNKIINGDFGIWQRGTSFSNPSTTAYNADRWLVEHDGSGATRTVSQQTFTPGAAPVAGYESQYFLRYAVSGGTSNTFQQIEQRIEDVRTFAGNPVTFSFWAKGDAARTINILINRNFGSGGSAADQSSVGSTLNITTSWARYSVTATMASVTGKTIGAGSYAQWIMRFAAATAQTIDIWGVQLEYGSKATPFETASGGSPQAELAMCQRYYMRFANTGAAGGYPAIGASQSASSVYFYMPLPVQMRAIPTTLEYSNVRVVNYGVAAYAIGTMSIDSSSTTQNTLVFTADGMTGMTANRPFFLYGVAGANYVGCTAEL